eukprot:592731-Pyramimonas_sp.AAC.1
MISLNGRNPVVQVHVTSTGGMGGCGFPRRHCGPRGPTSTTWARLNQRPARALSILMRDVNLLLVKEYAQEGMLSGMQFKNCLLYTSDAADDTPC